MNVIHHTFVLERSYPVRTEKVFEALSDPDKKRHWYAEGSQGHDIEDFTMDFKVGGIEKASYRFNANSPFPGVALIAEGTHLDILPDRRVVIGSTMTVGDKHISASLVTFELVSTDNGTDLILTHQGAFFEGSDGPEMRQGGWSKLLGRLEAELAR